ncbi:ankyrin repeat domain-containing protein 44 [Coprinopsis cinerea okayama7|uniref:Ankyrin repeat domain-containing protein 44 n=1 Tax=Coprinopsis cinerea (strain Okayama-7 / 130 / ATCC MYA-4618 / FGSC 9003) TaxID=240176 RepID=A8N4G9_COPC7|nr:ankyrin repeat domain-containing protein 44 [Coprinopsis cinerea okayama7\|eukprot:XP_001829837.2 ankyrin repeat domain-containing protein 44 [Coprinopsis cinerea okayama7\
MTVASTSRIPADVATKIVLQAGSQVTSGATVTTGNVIQHFHANAPPDNSNGKLVEEIADWLKTKVNFRAIHNDVTKKRAEDTGDWFIDSPAYKEWKQNKGSRVIDDLLHEESNDPKICVLFTYNRYDDLLSTAEILKGLVLQATQKQIPQFLDAVKSTQSRCKQQRVEPTEDDMISLLLKLEDIFDRVYYIFDGADELVQPHVKTKTLEGLIKAINGLKGGNAIIASRPLQVLKKFERVTEVELNAQSDDMRILINGKIDWSPNLREVLEESGKREEIVDDIIDRAGGMFLHAALQVETLDGCPTIADVREELRNFPKDITAMYKKTFDRIEGQHPRFVTLAKMTLLWLVHAKGSLRVEDLRAALGVSPETFSVEEDRIPKLDAIISACSGLIEHHQETGVARLVHFTARDALEPLLARDFPQPHKLITKILLQRMIDNNIPNCTVEGWSELRELLRKPLLDYAYKHWAEHVRECGEEDDTRRDVANFLCKCTSFPQRDQYSFMGYDSFQPLHLAAAYNFPWFIEEVLARHNLSLVHNQQPCGHSNFEGLDVNAQSREGVTALRLAALHGHGSCIQLLLGFPAIDVNTGYTTPLAQAAWNGHADIVERLLKVPGIDVNAGFATALAQAAGSGHADIVERLLKVPGIDVNAGFENALAQAAGSGHADIVERLLKVPGIDVNAGVPTALAQAAESGHTDIVERLLKVPGIDVNAGDPTALARAVGVGHTDMVERLLKVPCIDVNAGDTTALAWAALSGRQDIVERLLKVPGIDVNAGVPTALARAAGSSHTDIVERLLKVPGIDVNAGDPTALARAVGVGHTDMVERLLKVPGIDVNAGDTTALAQAAESGHTDIVERLLKVPGIDVNAGDPTALARAVGVGHTDMVERLLKVPGIDVNAGDTTALAWAALSGHTDIVERLLKVPGIDVNTGRATALARAAESGHTDIVERLLKVPGIDVNAPDTDVFGLGRTALMKAVANGHKDIVARLLKVPGIAVSVIDDHGRTALDLAREVAASAHRGIDDDDENVAQVILQMLMDAQTDESTPAFVDATSAVDGCQIMNESLINSCWAPPLYPSWERENPDDGSTSYWMSYSVESSNDLQPIDPPVSRGATSPTSL